MLHKRRRSSRPPFARLAALATVLALALALGFQQYEDDELFKLKKNFEIFGALYERLVTTYVDPVDAERVMRSGITAMLENLDPYTVFIDEADRVDAAIFQQGRLADVGLELDFRNGALTVVAPANGGAAFKQGVRAGDVIIEVAGRGTQSMTAQDVYSLLRGEPGSLVEIVVRRQGADEPLSFMLTREVSRPSPVTYADFLFDDDDLGVAYVKLANFTPGADLTLRSALSDLRETGNVKAVVIDLRDNLGGLLEAAVNIVGYFVPNGTLVVSTRGKTRDSYLEFHTKHAPLFPDLPLIILVNELSASASEIVAGAVQDMDRGIVVGQSTFGKGLAQVVHELPYNTSLKITSSRFFTPSGRNLQAIDYRSHDGRFKAVPDSLRRSFTTSNGRTVFDGRGIDPDLAIDMPEQSDLEQALEQRAAYFYFANHFAAQTGALERTFVVSDEVYGQFRSWLEDQSFTFATSSEKILQSLVDELGGAGYERARRSATDLGRLLDDHKEQDFETHADRIKSRLHSEIISRYFDEVEQLKIMLGRDRAIEEAIRLVTDDETYATMLGRS